MATVITYPDSVTWQADVIGLGAGLQTFTVTSPNGSAAVVVDVPFPARRVAVHPMLGKSFLAGPYARIVYQVGDVGLPVTHLFSADGVVKNTGVPNNFLAQIGMAQDAAFSMADVTTGATGFGSVLGLGVDATLSFAASQAMQHALGMGFAGRVDYSEGVADISVYSLESDAVFDLPGVGSIAFPSGYGLIFDGEVTYPSSSITGRATIQAVEPHASITARVAIATVAGAPDKRGVVVARSIHSTIQSK